MAKFLKLIKNKKGATAIEYGLIAALIAVAAIAAMQTSVTSWAGPSTTFRTSWAKTSSWSKTGGGA